MLRKQIVEYIFRGTKICIQSFVLKATCKYVLTTINFNCKNSFITQAGAMSKMINLITDRRTLSFEGVYY